MHITGTLISYYFYCKRRMWLHANDIRFECTSDDVAMGVLVEESSYQQRASKYEQVAIDGIKVDFYSAKDKVIHEVKKSNKFHETHIWQLKYYIYMFEKNGISGVTGILEYPKERLTEQVFLSELDRDSIDRIIEEIRLIVENDKCPSLLTSHKCKNCSYNDFCYSNNA